MEILHSDSYTCTAAERRVAREGGSASLEALAELTRVAFLTHCYVREKNTLFAGRSDGLVAMWHLLGPGTSSEAKDFVLGSHGGPVHGIAFHEDMGTGGLLFTGAVDRSIKVWDPWVRDVKDSCIQTIVGHGGTINSLCTGPGCVISTSNDGSIRVWRPDPSRSLLLYPWFVCTQEIKDGTAWVTSCAIKAGDMVTMYIGDANGTLSVYTGATPMSGGDIAECDFKLKRRQKKMHRLGITELMLITEQNLLCSLSYDGTIRVSDASSGSALLIVEHRKRKRYTGFAWNGFNQELFLIDELGYCYVWNIYMDKCLKEVRLTAVPTTSLTLLPDQTFYVTAGETVQHWRISRELQFSVFAGHSDAVVSIAALEAPSPDREDDARVFSASLDNTICCWDPYDMTKMFSLKEPSSEISCMTYIASANLIVTGNDDGSLRFWNPDAGSSVVFTRHTNTVSCLCMSGLKKSHYLLSGGYDGQLGIWDVTKRRSVKPTLEYIFQAHSNAEDPEILAVAFHDTGNDKTKCFLTAGNDGVIRVWNLSSYREVANLEGHEDAVTAMELDANFLFSGGEDGVVKIWNMANLSEPYCLSTFTAHRGCVRAMLMLPDVSLLATAAFDGRIKLWDYHHYDEETGVMGRVVTEFRHKDHFRCLTYRPRARHILTGTDQNNILLFPLSDAAISSATGGRGGSTAGAAGGAGGATDEEASDPQSRLVASALQRQRAAEATSKESGSRDEAAPAADTRSG